MTIETLHTYESQLTSLHTNVQKGTPSPHKAILLLAIIDLIEKVDPKYSRNWIKDHYQYAQIDDALFTLLQNDRVRAEFRLALIAKYLIGHPIEHTIGKASDSNRSYGISALRSLLCLFIA